MALQGPTCDDVRKIQAEINQLVNQRFLLTTIAITAFGVVTGMLVPRTPPLAGSPEGGFIFVMSTILSILLFSLFLLSHFYKGMSRVYSMYLVVTEKSTWEADWKKYRKDRYLGYTKPRTIIFLMLNALTTAFPTLLSIVYSIQLQPVSGLVILLVIAGIAEFLMLGMGFWNWFDRERKVEQQWQSLSVEKEQR